MPDILIISQAGHSAWVLLPGNGTFWLMGHSDTFSLTPAGKLSHWEAKTPTHSLPVKNL